MLRIITCTTNKNANLLHGNICKIYPKQTLFYPFFRIICDIGLIIYASMDIIL